MTASILAILWPLLKTFWWILPIFFGIAYLKTPSGKGFLGEAIVNLSANLLLDGANYRLLKNVTLPTSAGTTQIDHIIVSTFGLFVIETKNYAGWIFGDAKQKMWTQKLRGSNRQFQNPLHQNYKHAKILADLLGVESDRIFSVVVFVGNSRFKTAMPENVTYAGGYIRYVKSKVTPLFSTSDVNQIVTQIEQIRLMPSMKTNREHKRHVKQLVAAKTESRQQEVD